MAPTLTEYNELGQTVKQTVLLDQLHPGDPAKNRISESSSCYQIRKDGIYQVQTSITYNAEGLPLTQTTETMVSQLDPVVESKALSFDVYGQRVFSGRNTPLPPSVPSSVAFPLRISWLNPL